MAKNVTKLAHCAGCGEKFYSRNKGINRGGWTRYCSKSCFSRTTHYKGGPAASRRRRRYGMEPEEYQRLLDEQDGKCALCLEKPHYDLYVDHDHTTKENRSLLCARCNTAVGVFDRLSWDDVLLFWGYSQHHASGKKLAQLLRETLEPREDGSGNVPLTDDGYPDTFA